MPNPTPQPDLDESSRAKKQFSKGLYELGLDITIAPKVIVLFDEAMALLTSATEKAVSAAEERGFSRGYSQAGRDEHNRMLRGAQWLDKPKNDIQAAKGVSQLPNTPTRWPKGGEDE